MSQQFRRTLSHEMQLLAENLHVFQQAQRRACWARVAARGPANDEADPVSRRDVGGVSRRGAGRAEERRGQQRKTVAVRLAFALSRK